MLQRGATVGTLAILAAAALSGCLHGAPDGTDADGLTAMDALARFEAAGKTPGAGLPWSEDMALVAMGAIETSSDTLPDSIDTPPYPLRLDPLVGDGRASEWSLAYADPAAEDVVVARVSATEIIFHANHDPSIRADDHPLTAWRLDSAEAIRIARNDGGLAPILDAPGVAVSSLLMPVDAEEAVWLVHAAAPGVALDTVFVDATSGELLSFGDLVSNGPAPTARSYRFTGAVDAANPTDAHPYTQEGEGYWVWLNLTYTATEWPDAALEAALEHDGYAISWDERALGENEVRYRWLDVGPGPYMVRVEALDAPEGAASADYTATVDLVPRV